MLTYLGFPCGDIDGDFGKKTEAAVKKYQTAIGIRVDGICGKTTWKYLILGKKNLFYKVQSFYEKNKNKDEINNNEIISKLDEYDRKLKETTSSEEIRNIIIDMINIYKDKEDIKMAKIS